MVPQHRLLRRKIFSYELQSTATAYEAIETIPTSPPRPGHYYTYPPIYPGDGSTLAALLAQFNPATEIYRQFIQLLIAIAFWGGEGDTLPLFFVVSEDGRGAGKTTLDELCAELGGGLFAISPAELTLVIVKRLLTPEASSAPRAG